MGEKKKGNSLEPRLAERRGHRRKAFSLSLSSHLPFFAVSVASPRGLAAAAAEALELLVTVTPKRRSDFWTARSSMNSSFFVRVLNFRIVFQFRFALLAH